MLNKENKMIAVWGSPGSGKTVTSLKLAKELSRQKKDVLVVLCDLICPALPTVTSAKNSREGTLGQVLSAPYITQELIMQNCVLFDGISNVSILGYKKGNNVFTYAEYDKERALDFFTLLRHIADYVIVDCASSLSEDILSTTALEIADKVYRLGNCDLKSVSYFSSYLPLIGDVKFASNKHIRVLSNVKPRQEFAEYANLMGGVNYTLPYMPEVDEQYFTLSLLSELLGKKVKSYEMVIQKMVKDLINGCVADD